MVISLAGNEKLSLHVQKQWDGSCRSVPPAEVLSSSRRFLSNRNKLCYLLPREENASTSKNSLQDPSSYLFFELCPGTENGF